MGKTRRPVVKLELLRKSREAALNAVQTFNNPLTTFKAETFIVLMVIAWTYLLHAYYRREGVEYRYYEKRSKRRRFNRTTSGAYRYWELGKCLSVSACPLDNPTKSNLSFLIGLRNEIEHHQSVGSDERFSERYLACCLNFERYVCQLFGDQYSLGSAAAFTLQFRDISTTKTTVEAETPLPSNVATYVREFDAELTEEEFSSPYFRCRFLFVPLVTSKQAQADEVIQFVPFDSELGKSINEAHRQVFLKEVERQKYLPSQIVELMKSEGYVNFSMHHHTQLWQRTDAKNPGKGFGVMIANHWYWYERWLCEVRKHCAANRDRYAPD